MRAARRATSCPKPSAPMCSAARSRTSSVLFRRGRPAGVRDWDACASAECLFEVGDELVRLLDADGETLQVCGSGTSGGEHESVLGPFELREHVLELRARRVRVAGVVVYGTEESFAGAVGRGTERASGLWEALAGSGWST